MVPKVEVGDEVNPVDEDLDKSHPHFLQTNVPARSKLELSRPASVCTRGRDLSFRVMGTEACGR